MTKIKMCGLSRECDIEYANIVKPEYIGFVFAKKSRRYVTPERAAELVKRLDKGITPVGVFVDENPEVVADIVSRGIIKIAQLHGNEDEEYINALKARNIPVIKAFVIKTADDAAAAVNSPADMILLDSGKGSGTIFDWSLISSVGRDYFLAGGLTPENVGEAVRTLDPYAVDLSSALETDGFKDLTKMREFAERVREFGQ